MGAGALRRGTTGCDRGAECLTPDPDRHCPDLQPHRLTTVIGQRVDAGSNG